ncbi:hypothetical protein [Streptomyces sp. CC208A]|uniref:hypothetical protein n=1 Tax=Streptomyces sp. CC208A TaxID=3044573 RepID=UPI0024A8DAD9|nr:hypothetical protein [Streptomyces sp. CC208A]
MGGRFGARRRLEVLQMAVAGLGVPGSLGIGVVLTAYGLHVGVGLAATALVLMATAAALAKLDAFLSRHPAPPSRRSRPRHPDGGGHGGGSS